MRRKVILVDDHISIRQMLGVILAREQEYEVVAEARTGIEALRACREVQHHVVILDIELPELSGTEVLKRVRIELPATRVLVYSGTCCPMQASRILQMKPHGFIEKGDSLQTLRDALRAVSAGGCYFAASASPLLMRGASLEHQELSEREIEVLQMVAEGKSSKEIASILARAVKTVENHRAHIMEKLHVHDVAGLTRYATRHGLVR